MALHTLKPIVARRQKRVGQGWASGAGTFSGRGANGQKKRGQMYSNFTGGQMLMSKGLPMLRGKFKNKPLHRRVTITLQQLERSKFFKNDSLVNPETLIQAGLMRVSEAHTSVARIVGTGEITKKLRIAIGASSSAIKKIQHAGGTLTP